MAAHPRDTGLPHQDVGPRNPRKPWPCIQGGPIWCTDYGVSWADVSTEIRYLTRLAAPGLRWCSHAAEHDRLKAHRAHCRDRRVARYCERSRLASASPPRTHFSLFQGESPFGRRTRGGAGTTAIPTGASARMWCRGVPNPACFRLCEPFSRWYEYRIEGLQCKEPVWFVASGLRRVPGSL